MMRTYQEPIVTAVAKRALDLTLSVLILLLFLPVMAGIAIVVRLDSPGPILFRQARIGRGGIPFPFMKFRTMYADAKERFPERYDYSYSDDDLKTRHFFVAGDPRVTRVGRWLRTTSLDELPNLFCVIKGDMSLVGPRPQIPEMMAHFKEHERIRFEVKPGVTGVSSVSGRNLLTMQEEIDCDLQYMAKRSFWFDIKLLLKTVVVVFRRVGAY